MHNPLLFSYAFLTTVSTGHPLIVSLSLVFAVVIPVWKYVTMNGKFSFVAIHVSLLS
jgi:hypothetical protein